MISRFFALVPLLLMVFSCSAPEDTGNADKRPNILLVVADDLGYSDISPFGGDISTPVLAQLADESLLFSRFYVNPTCSPTRSSLLTGADNHQAGFGVMGEMSYPELKALDLPGYSAALTSQVVTIPEVLRDAGYHTYMVGKWHLGDGPEYDPYQRGFEQTFILETGGGSHFDDRRPLSPLQHMEYTRNGKAVELPEDFYSTTSYTDSMIAFIDRNKEDQIPFFGFLSYTAVHDPLHTPEAYIEKYRGHFDKGYDSLWTERLSNLQQLGIIARDLRQFSKNPTIPAWNTLPDTAKALLARDMEVYAGMLDYLDESIGRVFDYLRTNGFYDNTMIVFISDNGANGAMANTYPGNEDGNYLATFDNSPDNRGLKGSYIEAGPGWAQASSAPFRYFKGFASEGGIRAPLIIKPAGGSGPKGWNHNFFHVTDMMPTFVEAAGASYPETYNGNPIVPYIGKSILPVLTGDTDAVHAGEGYGWELFEMKAYIRDNWKILRLPWPMGTGEWQLYDVILDPAEAVDLSAQHPDIKAALIDEWEAYARRNKVHDHQGHYDAFYREKFTPAAIDD